MFKLTARLATVLLGASMCSAVSAVPISSLVSVTWEVPATQRSPVINEAFLRGLNYRASIEGKIHSFFIADPAQLLDNQKKVLRSVPPPGKPGDPIPKMDKVSVNPSKYVTAEPYSFRFQPPIDATTAAIRFGGDYFAASQKTKVGALNSSVIYETVDGTVSLSLHPKETQVEFSTFRLSEPGKEDPDLEFSISNPGDVSIRIESLQYLISNAALPYDSPVGSVSDFLPFPPSCSDVFWLEPGTESQNCLITGLLPGQWLYVEGAAYESAASQSLFRYGYRVPEPGSLGLASVALAMLFVARRRRQNTARTSKRK